MLQLSPRVPNFTPFHSTGSLFRDLETSALDNPKMNLKIKRSKVNHIHINTPTPVYRPCVAQSLERPLGVREAGVRSPTASHQRRKKWEVCASQLGASHMEKSNAVSTMNRSWTAHLSAHHS